MDVIMRHIVRRGGWGHEGMTSPIVFDMDSGESTLFETDSQLSEGLRPLAQKGTVDQKC